MRVMDFNDINPRFHRPLRRRHEGHLKLLNLLERHSFRIWEVPWRKGDSTRRQHIFRPPPDSLRRHSPSTQPRRHTTRLPPRMRKLNSDFLPLGVRELNRSLKRLDLGILPQPAVFRGDPALGDDGGGFDHCQPRAALQDAAQVREVPRGVVAVFGRVLAEGGEHDAVLEGEGAEGEGGEEFGGGGAIGYRCSCRGGLGGGEVGDLGGGVSWVFFWRVRRGRGSYSGLRLILDISMGRHLGGVLVYPDGQRAVRMVTW